MLLIKLLIDGFFAAIAGCGFGAISNPPRRAFLYIAILAAIGHALRTLLMGTFAFDIATASLCAGILIGFTSLPLGRISYCPATVLYIPALLPMIPGKFAYNSIFSMILFVQNINDEIVSAYYMEKFFANFMVTCSVIFLLAVGATFPVFVFPNKAYRMTRHQKK